MSYRVVFEYTDKVPGYAGVRTWTTFAGEKEFTKWYTPAIQEREKVVEAGELTDQYCVDLTAKTPFSAYVKSSIQEATGPEGVNDHILVMQLGNILMAAPSLFQSDEDLRRWLAYQTLIRKDSPFHRPNIKERMEALTDNNLSLSVRVLQALEVATKADGSMDEKALQVLIALIVAKTPLSLEV